MSYRNDDIELVRRARLGERDSLDRLAELARVRVHEYVLRLTLDEDLTQDIVQETILEMLRIFTKLRRAETFWGWLHGIAFNKVRNHYGKRWRRKTRNFSETGYEPGVAGGNDTLAQVVTEEIKQIVMDSVTQLTPRHRAVLTMRCYDHLSYREIADLMGCSEIGVRAAFYRAKKSLARRLASHGLEKGSLLLALITFGKMTATSKASAAQVDSAAIIGTPDNWNWQEPTMLTGYLERAPGLRRSVSAYLRSYIADASVMFCPNAPRPYPYLQEAWDAGDAWDHPETLAVPDSLVGVYCLY